VLQALRELRRSPADAQPSGSRGASKRRATDVAVAARNGCGLCHVVVTLSARFVEEIVLPIGHMGLPLGFSIWLTPPP
jgi:hypothetical protein